MTKRKMQRYVKSYLGGVILFLYETEFYTLRDDLYIRNGDDNKVIPITESEADYIYNYAIKVCNSAAGILLKKL